ncbi:protein Mom [Serratia marcescens]|uniref:Mom family adenine methylcarbamoylation protein n=1 Tax=Serratia TaxID=613 RepID=UPI001154AF62|nr:protein Mom [Serratia marcescens]ELQ9311825.1 protein Mom [Serratia marcescens]ELQ9441962.1 protein Mom [Serratia marcescens]ELT5562488.1 protein Mom [Serratia marcescens]MBH3189304.1 protein Mom [Serratia marcescens]NMQ37602.1 protein Mom [Serratia marcescens]
MTTLTVDWATHKAAAHACLNWHYAKAVPVGKLVKVGAWEDGRFIGVVIFSRGANNHIGQPYGLQQDQVCELTRVALRDHVSPVSQILAKAIKFLATVCPGLRLIVSYADKDQNHHGGIYQATNWIYEGLFGVGTLGAFIVKGKKVHPRSVAAKGVKQSIEAVRQQLDPNAQEFKTSGKHKYLMPLDKKMKKSLLPRHKPYPKRT